MRKRAKRIMTAIQWLAAGKKQNWKYLHVAVRQPFTKGARV